ncbi:DUF3014 domain-containing protein [Alteromonas sp. RKMC-009]|uniref:DUF3014 domain-containing protein n=1 Tax=Alteromonas sp. RKMC-009 TaxID=2267264 RepID=UPI000C3801D5|nr:DUF3014 domain-containing protein [Alteromonas sp. RKMC-009]AYA66348.1 DUF3014 domain-containing protein [Alteromonas sp. RKMC-009]MBT79843.1 hypothetical protein [Alteromonadaceae bacterium]MEC7690443.1 DUF3014 domain-containing protein [Pseudomonadota bacterium]
MSDDSEKKTLAPHILIIAVIVVVIIAVLLWPSKEEPAPVTEEVPAEEMPVLPDEPDDFQPAPPPEPVDIDPVDEPEPMPEQPEPEPEPLDVSDKGVEEALNAISGTEEANNLIVNEGLIQRFVVTVTNLANDEMPAAQQVPLTAPEQTFKVYRQADKEWIDAASYKRYTPYVTMMESFDNEALLDLFKRYKGEIQSKYDEIGQPGQPFESVVVEAIDQLLDTPEVPVPVEVYSDSVAYKYADPQLEELSTPQKQLLRTGPDNMRRIKAKLRELKSLLADDGF